MAKTEGVELDIYCKQGEAWDTCLKKDKGSVFKALETWAKSLEETADRLRAVARVVKGLRGLKGIGDNHTVRIEGLTGEQIDDVVAASASDGC